MRTIKLGDTYAITSVDPRPGCLWVIAGVHGEEPAPLAAVASRMTKLVTGEWRYVIIPMANPTGVVSRTRYGSYGLVGGHDFVQDMARLAKLNPPTIVLDLHEDDEFFNGAYLYHTGSDDEIPSRILEAWKVAGVDIAEEGRPRFFDQEVAHGTVMGGDDDGSIDWLLHDLSGADVVVTETPLFWGVDTRIGTHQIAIDAILGFMKETDA